MINNILFLSLLLLLTSCPNKEPMWYNIFVSNSDKIDDLKIFIHQNNPGDSLLPINKGVFSTSLKNFNTDYSTAFRICIHEIRGIRDCIRSQPEQKIYVFVFEADTLDAYDYDVIREKKKYKDRIEIHYSMATNDADLTIEYP